jgi:DNA-binding NarL/FixJ family response regulator
MKRTAVVLVDDNELTLAGFATGLREHPDFEVMAAMGHEEAVRAGID